MNYKGQKITLGSIYRNMLNNINNDEEVAGDIKSIVLEMNKAEGVDDTRMNELFQNLRLQLKTKGFKDIRSDQQKHLLEETFTKTLEAYSYGTVDAVIKNTKVQEQLKKDLIEFYKKTKKLATEEEAKNFLDLTVGGVQNLDIEAAIKHVLLDFSSTSRKGPKVENSGYADQKRAKKSKTKQITSRAATFHYVGNYMGRNLTDLVIANRVLKDMEKDGLLKRLCLIKWLIK